MKTAIMLVMVAAVLISIAAMMYQAMQLRAVVEELARAKEEIQEEKVKNAEGKYERERLVRELQAAQMHAADVEDTFKSQRTTLRDTMEEVSRLKQELATKKTDAEKRKERNAKIAELAAEGMSARQIAKTIGCGRTTVTRVINAIRRAETAENSAGV